MLRGVRGATTVGENRSREILSATRELLREMVKANRVKIEDVSSIIFSVTADLNAEFPARAARELGWGNVPLLCTYEIKVPGSLKKCIRVLMLANTKQSQKAIKHIYLKGAQRLRREFNS
ncbi:chorismate mutase [Candidatus Saganbacteria bacterium]|nr:chorismate mutase [Candidatus Saganbacteria bacterium]